MSRRSRSSGSAPGRGVAVEQRAGHAGDDQLVLVDVLLGEAFGERGVVLQDRRPGTAARVLAEGLAVLRHRGNDRLQAVLAATKARCSAKR